MKSKRLKFDLLKTLVQRDLEARYKGSILGNLWPLLNQLSQLLIYTYVFSIVLHVKSNIKGIEGDSSLVFGLWLFAGLIPWIAFTSGLMGACTSVIAQTNLVKKVVFPLALLPLVPVLTSFVESTFGLVLLIVFTALLSGALHPTLVLLPLVFLPQILLTAGLGYLLAGFTTFLRDTPQIIGVIINLWFYLTPVVYPISAIPEGIRPWIFRLNPLAAIAEVYRDLVLTGSITYWREWIILMLLSGLIFKLGLSVYQRLRPGFADVL